MKLILASRSPERANILRELGWKYQVSSADIDESPKSGEKVPELVLRLATEKAAFIAAKESATVIAADTLIECQGEPLGQPVDREHAQKMFEQYKVSPLKVWTASVWHCTDGEVWSDLAHADLQFFDLDQAQWNEFYERELWKRRAGAFSIFHQPCPMKIVEGDFDVVRGIHSKWLQECYHRECDKLSPT